MKTNTAVEPVATKTPKSVRIFVFFTSTCTVLFWFLIVLSPRPSARVLIRTCIEIFHEAGGPSLARMRECDVTLRSNVVPDFWNFYVVTVDFLLQLVYLMYHVKSINERNNETQEPNDCERELRLQQRREQAEQDLPVMRQNPT